MIVKDESKLIKRCLDSVKPYIDYWVIVDTGSKDGTQKIIKNHMKGIPGKLYERPWKNWGESRTEALKLAQGNGDYILFMDADDLLEFENGATLDHLTADQYTMWRGAKGFSYLKPQLAKSGLPWKWVGVTHEYLDCDKQYTSETLKNVHYRSLGGGATWKDPKAKFMKNVELLETALKKEPENARYAFYLAESYKDAGEKAKALEWYQKRIKMGGWAEETFISMLHSGHMLKELGLPNPIVIEAFLTAHRFRPHRIEPIYFLCENYLEESNHKLAYDLIKSRDFIPQPVVKDGLFNADWIADYGLDFQLSICSFYVGKHKESLALCEKLLKNPDLPDAWREATIKNKEYPLAKLNEVQKVDAPKKVVSLH
jgi:glycosyltransferase involved in cell wall biosynthesis